MIGGIFHKGSGLGDQLMRYVTVRTLAEAKGYEWEMTNPSYFKGADFLTIPYPKTMPPKAYVNRWEEKEVRDVDGDDIRSYDPEINFVEDNTVIDGCFEDFKYWGHNLHKIDKWLQVEPITIPDDVCLIGFRGGEYYTNPNLGLPDTYFNEAIMKIQNLVPGISFEVHTDDPALAQQKFPTLKIIQDIGINWRSMRYAKYAIIANSAFYIMPRLLSGGTTIAPRYWARRNIKKWARPACYYDAFTYL